MVISPIETKYNGYKFRSRLEARWAVFFDKINTAYQYEIEGFDLHYHGRYLPDFYLSKYNTWIEVKPTLEFDKSNTSNIDFLAKPIELAICSRNIVVVVSGDPLEHYSFAISPKTGFCHSNMVNKYLFFTELSEYIEFTDTNHHIKEANIAREARFEFGETQNSNNENAIKDKFQEKLGISQNRIVKLMLESLQGINFLASYIPEHNQEFIKSLYTSHCIYDTLTEKQMMYVARYYKVARGLNLAPDFDTLINQEKKHD